MQTQTVTFLLVGFTLIVILGAFGLMALKSRQVNLTKPKSPNEKPEWMRSMPPKETVAATLADSEGITLYNHDEGERIAAPFSEQIEDILNALISETPELSSYKVDLGTSETGSLQFWVNETAYDRIEDIPNQILQDVIKQAIAKWEAHK